MKGREVVIFPEDSKDGIDLIRCAHTLEKLAKSFVVDGVRYYIPAEKLKEGVSI